MKLFSMFSFFIWSLGPRGFSFLSLSVKSHSGYIFIQTLRIFISPGFLSEIHSVLLLYSHLPHRRYHSWYCIKFVEPAPITKG